jgi:hypothetical protein
LGNPRANMAEPPVGPLWKPVRELSRRAAGRDDRTHATP